MKALRNPSQQCSIDMGLSIRLLAMFIWAIGILMVQVSSHIALGVIFIEHTNPCSFHHESANNIGGWSIASVAVLVPTIVGLFLRRMLTVAWVLVVACAQIYLFVSFLLNWNGC